MHMEASTNTTHEAGDDYIPVVLQVCPGRLGFKGFASLEQGFIVLLLTIESFIAGFLFVHGRIRIVLLLLLPQVLFICCYCW